MGVFDVINNGPITQDVGGLPGALGVDTENAALYVGTPSGWASVAGGAGGVSDVTAAATIAPKTGVIELSGTTQVTTITPPANFPKGGKLTIIPTAASGQSTATGGNIALGSTLVQYKALTMTWDGTSWYPSY